MSKSEKDIQSLNDIKNAFTIGVYYAHLRGDEKSAKTKQLNRDMVELTNEYVDLSSEGATLDGYFSAVHLRTIADKIDQLKAMESKEEVKGTL